MRRFGHMVQTVLIVAVTFEGAHAGQGSLADVAKRTEEERAMRGSATRTLTNDDLPAAAGSGLTPVPAAPALVPAGKVTPGIFDGVYRAAKAVEGATASGVNYVKFSELLQSFTSEIVIVKDKSLNEADKQLLALFVEALGHYRVSRSLWELKISVTDYKGDIPIGSLGQPNADLIAARKTLLRIAADYKIPLVNRILLTGAPYQALPGDAPQRVWIKAEEVLGGATGLYNAR
ncbi:MAG: hypothetical protein ACREF4_13965 [Gammaproteobacteria bacterium]